MDKSLRNDKGFCKLCQPNLLTIPYFKKATITKFENLFNTCGINSPKISCHRQHCQNKGVLLDFIIKRKKMKNRFVN